jgi:hypothetical protein
MKRGKCLAVAIAAGFMAMSQAAQAQAIKPPRPIASFSAEEVAAVAMPDTVFEATPADVETYDKYFYFHRDDTDFNTAFNDLSECDALSGGLSYYSSYDPAMGSYYASQYGVGAVLGSVVSDALEDAIFGSTERRRIRRVNMRNCMGYKGYSRYGLERERWQAFHFEEGFRRVDDDKRTAYLLKQARVASGPKPAGEALVR